MPLPDSFYTGLGLEKLAGSRVAWRVKPPAVTGQVRVRYNHYNQLFDVIDGQLRFEDIDDKYAFSYAFKGNFTATLHTPCGQTIEVDGGGLRREMRKDPDGFDPDEEEERVVGNFSGLSLLDDDGHEMNYTMHVEEDPELAAAAAPRTVYKAAGDSAGALGGSRGSALITAELKKMSSDELREGGAKYRELLEARDLEDMMAGV